MKPGLTPVRAETAPDPAPAKVAPARAALGQAPVPAPGRVPAQALGQAQAPGKDLAEPGLARALVKANLAQAPGRAVPSQVPAQAPVPGRVQVQDQQRELMLEKATLGQDREDSVLIPGKAVPGQVLKMAALDQVVRNPMRTTTKAKATLAYPPA